MVRTRALRWSGDRRRQVNSKTRGDETGDCRGPAHRRGRRESARRTGAVLNTGGAAPLSAVGNRNTVCLQSVVQPLAGNFQPAPYPFWRKHQIDHAPKLVRDELFDDAGTIAR
jgi:hypothetical protein